MILDTHTLLWLDRNDPVLGSKCRRQVETAWRNGQVAVSAITFWETAMLAQRGRIVLPVAVDQWRSDWLCAGLMEIPINGRIALLSSALKDFHRDPADRFIVATALDRNDVLLTADTAILRWSGQMHRIDARL